MVYFDYLVIGMSWPEVIKLFFVLHTTEHEINHAYNVKMPTIVGILTL